MCVHVSNVNIVKGTRSLLLSIELYYIMIHTQGSRKKVSDDSDTMCKIPGRVVPIYSFISQLGVFWELLKSFYFYLVYWSAMTDEWLIVT